METLLEEISWPSEDLLPVVEDSPPVSNNRFILELPRFLKTGAMADVSISTPSSGQWQSLKCHKVVLSAISPLIKEAIHQLPPEEDVMIILPDMDENEGLELFLSFLYSGCANSSSGKVWNNTQLQTFCELTSMFNISHQSNIEITQTNLPSHVASPPPPPSETRTADESVELPMADHEKTLDLTNVSVVFSSSEDHSKPDEPPGNLQILVLGQSEEEPIADAKMILDDSSANVCDVCQAVFGSRATLSTHFNKFHKRLVCANCGKVSFGNIRHQEHVLTHGSKAPSKPRLDLIKPRFVDGHFLCPERGCSYSSAKAKNVMTHFRRHYNSVTDAVQCKVCLVTYTVGQTHTCSVSSTSIEPPTGVSLVTANDEEEDVDDVIDEDDDWRVIMSNVDKSKNKRTVRGQGDKQKRSCDICNKVFVTKQALSYHLHRHTGEKPYKCLICLARFRTPSTLNAHFKVQHGTSDNKCHVCGLQTSTKGKLKDHMMVHTGETPFQCAFCSQKFRQKSTLKVHEFRHTGKSNHRCEKCQRYLPTLGALTRHRAQPVCRTKKPKRTESGNGAEQVINLGKC